MTIRIDDVHAIKLLAQAASIQFVPRLHHCIANYSKDDKLLGGTLYTDYWGGSVGCHFAGFFPNWINRELLWLGFQYPFVQLGVNKLFGLIPEWNVTSRNTALRLGFQIEYLAPDVFNNPDGINGMYITSMYKHACRWLDMSEPVIHYAPPERTNPVVLHPLALMPTVGAMQ